MILSNHRTYFDRNMIYKWSEQAIKFKGEGEPVLDVQCLYKIGIEYCVHKISLPTGICRSSEQCLIQTFPIMYFGGQR